MAKFKQADLSRVKTIPIAARKSKVTTNDFAKLYNPRTQPFVRFIDSLPRILVAEDLRRVVEDIARARKRRKPVIMMLGAHVIKVGLSPLIIDLVKRKIITAVAMNSAAAIHDIETAMWGKTSEDVAVYLVDGRFGMSRETGEFINGVLKESVYEDDWGYGEALGKALIERKSPNKQLSILAACYTHDVPATVHAAIGTDIVHQQPSMNGAATGEMTFRDFKVLCHAVKDLGNGGVLLHVGSAVILPEVFLKALTVARNLGHNVKNFTTVNFDMLRHYRPAMNVVQRPTQEGGQGYNITGHHEIMIPLLCAMINARVRL
jgi:deoxyhypusine synthase